LSSDRPHIVILGGGPAGLGAAYRLASQNRAQVTLLEASDHVGGNAGSFDLAGLRVDYGSHRLHPACDPEVLADIRHLLGEDLLDRPRHGRIRLRGRWIHFPLKPADLALKLPPAFALGVATDLALKPLRGGGSVDPESFTATLEAGLGRTICQDFYFPYARKLWGLAPDELAATQARRRVSANSIGKMIRKVLAMAPGAKSNGKGRFYYPRRGYGQISQAYDDAARAAGARILLKAPVHAVETEAGSVTGVRYRHEDSDRQEAADMVWSTIPITNLARCFNPGPPEELLCAAQRIDFRAMILIYLVLDQDRFSEYDAHYFPEPEIAISRLSEPKNYSATSEPRGRTVLCAELPCAPDGPEWSMADQELGQLVLQDLETAGIAPRAKVREVVARRLRHAYPIYRQGYEVHFDQLDHWIGQIDGLLSFGRQGLFAHDNTHHALYMAYAAVACLDGNGSFDTSRWQHYRRIFETHVVED
jgi:protoporphyrinogen oxidase